jgi:hypothetical protein
MDIFMTVGTKVFPVASVWWVIQMVPVLVVDRQELSLGRGEFPTTSGADQAMEGQRSFPVILLNGDVGPDFCHNLLNRFIAGWVGF